MRSHKWALLCGIDFYIDGKARSKDDKLRTIPNLAGCVRDAEFTYDMLVKLGVPPSHIKLLTASCPAPSGGSPANRPSEDECLWPTRKNIELELDWIKGHACKGDLVYFHYSGHGAHRSRLELSMNETDDGSELDGMALVMTDVLLGGHYLTGYYLGELMRKMVKDKELRITLVLDSCHSGAGWRADDVPEGLTPRTVLKGELDGTWLSADEVADEPAIEIIDTDMEPAAANRNPGAGRKSSWLTDPSNCTVVTACGAGQVAGERTFGSNSLQGILTHWVVGIVGRFVGLFHPVG
jgi:hypothetical protein